MQTDTRTKNKTWYKISTKAKCDIKCGLKKGFASMQLDWTGQNRSKRFPIIERKEKGTRSDWQDFVLYHQDLKQV
jgi:hypothetical protein